MTIEKLMIINVFERIQFMFCATNTAAKVKGMKFNGFQYALRGQKPETLVSDGKIDKEMTDSTKPNI